MLRNVRVLATVMKTEGLVAVLKRLAFRFTHIHKFFVYRLSLTDDLPVVAPPSGIELREVTLAELRDLRQGRTDLPEYFYRDETGTRGRCWVGLRGGRMGFILWYTYENESGMVDLQKDQIEAAYAYALKDMRGLHLTQIAFRISGRELGREGIRSILAVPHSETVAINKTFIACGFDMIGEIKRYGFFTVPRTPVKYPH